ncbi:Uncharacterised protein [Mycobacteroides abscessus subsp. abscessus]|nr:Uncharacterised protein [Mycobacteroides abscessus subsp. abscessus]
MADPGIVDQCVDPPEQTLHRLGSSRSRPGIGDVESDGDRVAASCADLRDDLLPGFLVARADHHHVAQVCELLGDLPADPLVCAGYYCDLLVTHRFSLSSTFTAPLPGTC